MFYFDKFKKVRPIFLLSLFAVFVLLASLFLNAEFASAGGTWTHCQGPLVGYDTNYGNYQFDCNNSDLNTYTYYCEETASQLAYCRSFANPSSDYYDCGMSTNNMKPTANGYLFVNCSLMTDTQNPIISNFTATPVSSSQIDLSWTATDDVGVTEIDIQRSQVACGVNGCVVAQLTPFHIPLLGSTTLYSDTNGLSANQQICYVLCAYDAMRNQTCTPGYVCATTLSDSTPPSNITNLSISSCSFSSCSLSWTAPGNDGNVGTASSYDMRYSTSPINNSNWNSATEATGEPVPTAAGTTQLMSISELSQTTTYYFAIKSSDGTNNVSALSNVPVTGTTTAVPDTIAPSSPNPNLQAMRDATNPSSQINISWNAYTDNVGVAGYRIERCQGAGCSNFVQINTSVAANYSDGSLSSSTSYSYRIRAYDAAIPANISSYSNIASATTAAPPDTLAPYFTPTSPSDPLPAGTTSAILRGDTNEPATCRYAASSQSFDSMPPMIQMTTTDGITHSAPLSGLSDNQSYTYYIKCRDGASIPNTSGDFIVSFSVSAPPPDTSPPLISGGQPSGTLPFFSGGSGTVIMSVFTNEAAYCRYNQAIDTDFGSMAANPLNTNPAGDILYQKYHFTTLTVFNGANYRYYVRCQDTTGPNTNTSGYPIIFSVATPPNTLPTVNLTASPTSGDAPLQVIVSGVASDPDGDQLTYSLDWGDGSQEVYAPDSSVAHTYNNAGSYTVTLIVVDSRGGSASDMEYITVNALQESILPPITGGICAVECNDNTECDTGEVCGPSHICIPEAAADAEPDRSGGYTSLTDGTIFANFPAGTQTVMIGLTTEANAECRFAVNQSTNNGEAGVAYDFNGTGITMNQFSTSDYRNHSAIINIGAAKSCSPGALKSCGYNKEDACPASGKCNSYGFSAVCRNTFGTLEPNITDYPILFSIGAPELLACVPGEMCPSGLPCSSTSRCEPAPYTCLINQYFIRNNIPYLLDICFPGFTPASSSVYVPPIVVPPVVVPPISCVSDGSCTGPGVPGCGVTLPGVNNCGNSCTRTGLCVTVAYSWFIGNWSVCSFPSSTYYTTGVGTRSRSVYCQNDSNPGVPVANSLCSDPAQSNSETCYQSPVSYNTVGTYTFIVPAGVANITVDVLGGGGAGGGGGYTTWIGGGGGGGGGYSNGAFTATPGTSYTVTVGSSWGSTAQLSSFGNLLSANGGAHGKAGDEQIVANRGMGGAGGTGTTANGVNGGNAIANNVDGKRTHGGNGGKAGGSAGGAGGIGIDSYSNPSISCQNSCYGKAPGGGGGGGSGGATSEGNPGGGSYGRVIISW